MALRTTFRALLMLLVGLGAQVQAATYNLPVSPFAPCQGTWTSASNTCSGQISFASGDIVTSSSAQTLTANGGFALRGNTIGTASNPITLQAAYNEISTISPHTATTIYGSVKNGSAAIALTNVTLNGSLETASGAVTLTNSRVTGSATGTGSGSLSGTNVTGNVRFDNGITISGGTFSGTVSTNTTASFTGGTIAGVVTAPNGLTANGTTFSSNVTSSNDVTFTGGSVAGTLTAGKLVATGGTVFSSSITASTTVNLTGGSVAGNITAPNGLTASNTDLGGNVKATNGATSITGGSISGSIEGGCCKITISNAYMTGSITAKNDIEVSGSTITGDISTTNKVTLSSSTVYGDVTAATSSTITGTGSSKVYGTCTPSATSPTTLCDSVPIQSCLSDNFNRSDLGSDWALTNRSGSFGNPVIVNGRMRLTDNSGDVATASTLQRLLPATGNFVQVQFRYYAYGGNGADGVAVVLSDASVTPQPGAFGGPLGYGTKNTAATTGFAGGWLGVGIDEYGNFSNEGGTNSVGQRQESVAVRGSGSGTSGYSYLRGTAANLNPGIDISGSTAGPGHIYRITLDSTTAGKTMVTVERNTGSGFTTLISSFDARASASQAALPSNFYLSLTGSTGGSNNIHELDDLQVCATKINPVGAQIDHFEFVTSSGANTCSPQTVTVTACSNAAPATCTPYVAGPVTVTLSSNGWIGGSSKVLTNGTGTFQLQGLATSMPLGVTASTPSPKAYSQTLCKIGAGALSSDCTLNFAQSGFIFDVPNKLANKEASNITISAVVDKGTLPLSKCVPAFINVDRSVNFWSDFIDPSGTALSDASQKVSVNDLAVGQTAATAFAVPLKFDSNGQSTLKVNYSEAGQMQLNASYAGSATAGDSGLMTGSDLFVSRPLGFCVYSNTANSDCATGAATASCSKFVAAGDNFNLGVRAVAWESNTDTNLCSGNNTTKNYREASVSLGASLVAPAGGTNASLGVSTLAMVNTDAGEKVLTNQTVSEVGVFTIAATAPDSYLAGPGVGNTDGSSDNSREVSSASVNIGRFYPAYLKVVGSASLTPSCGSAYSYQGQPIAFASGQEPLLTVTGYNRQGAVTTNYDRGAFWRLNTPTRDAYLSVISSRANLNARLASQGTVTTTTVDASTGDGYKAFRWSGEQLLYSPAPVPVSDDYSVAASIRQGFSAGVSDQDGACYLGSGSSCTTYSFDFGGSDVRLGRLRIGNARGSELQSLTLPVTLESWQNVAGGSFQAETQDTCTTAAVLGAVTLGNYTGNLAAGETTPTSTAPGSGTGIGSLLLSAPGSGNDGSVQALYSTLPSWLYFAWDGTTRSTARGLASFGIYRGATPLIYRRELYR